MAESATEAKSGHTDPFALLHSRIDELEELIRNFLKPEDAPKTNPEYLTSAEVRTLLRISAPTLYRLRKKGLLVPRIVGEGKRLYSRVDVDYATRSYSKWSRN